MCCLCICSSHLRVFSCVSSSSLVKAYLTLSRSSFQRSADHTRASTASVLADLARSARRLHHAMWSTFVADHALTVAIVDVTHGLMRADLTRSAFLVENVAASDFQQGSITFANVNSDQNNKVT